jgi:hypothetical protein
MPAVGLVLRTSASSRLSKRFPWSARWAWPTVLFFGDDRVEIGQAALLRADVGDRGRLIAFKRPESLVDPNSVREVWLSSDTFYSALREWRDSFLAEWESLPKHS